MSLHWFLVEAVIYIEIPFTFFPSQHSCRVVMSRLMVGGCLDAMVAWELNNFPSK